MNINPRIAVAALSLSAAAFIGMVSHEGYTSAAVIPTKGDVPTVGFGSTVNTDGSSVKMGQTVTPVRALVIAQDHISREETIFRTSLAGASLSQVEFDVYMDFVYQYGSTNWSSSSMRRDILAARYAAACDDLLQWKRAAGYDCSTPGNTRCWGVWQRQVERNKQCRAAQ